jgi:hypothetical protein
MASRGTRPTLLSPRKNSLRPMNDIERVRNRNWSTWHPSSTTGGFVRGIDGLPWLQELRHEDRVAARRAGYRGLRYREAAFLVEPHCVARDM